MPAPAIPSNKFKQQVDNNIYLRTKMQQAFIYAYDSLANSPLGALDTFDATIDGINLKYINGDQININDQPYSSCSAILKKQAYDRLEKFMKIALSKYNTQFNL